jgi:hypothetical protein
MHNYSHGRLQFSSSEIWITNRARNPNLESRNADNLYVLPHNFSSIKRSPLSQLLELGNEEANLKLNPAYRVYLKSVKSAVLNSIVV